MIKNGEEKEKEDNRQETDSYRYFSGQI